MSGRKSQSKSLLPSSVSLEANTRLKTEKLNFLVGETSPTTVLNKFRRPRGSLAGLLESL